MLKKCYQPYTTLVWVETAAERQLWVDSACHIRQVESKTAVQPGEIKLRSSNPKAILVFTAFLPQFVVPGQPITPQFALLGALFLALEWIAISLYAYVGLHMRRWFAEPRGKRIFNRCCAGLLSAAAAMLLMARRA